MFKFGFVTTAVLGLFSQLLLVVGAFFVSEAMKQEKNLVMWMIATTSLAGCLCLVTLVSGRNLWVNARAVKKLEQEEPPERQEDITHWSRNSD